MTPDQTEPLSIPETLGAARRGSHPWRELMHRARDPRLVMDTAVRTLLKGWDLLSPLEFSSLYRQVRTHTMCSNSRLRALYRGIRYVVSRQVPGDVVECGTALGGSAALMALALKKFEAQRTLWLFDTYEGLPAPSSEDPDRELAEMFTGSCVGTMEEVRELFHRLEVADGARFVKGLFQDTLPVAPIERIALLHIDGDWYESVKACLDNLYDKVVPGGVIQFDDYGYWKGARKAIDEFLERRRIAVSLQRLDYSGRSMLKPC